MTTKSNIQWLAVRSEKLVVTLSNWARHYVPLESLEKVFECVRQKWLYKTADGWFFNGSFVVDCVSVHWSESFTESVMVWLSESVKVQIRKKISERLEAKMPVTEGIILQIVDSFRDKM